LGQATRTPRRTGEQELPAPTAPADAERHDLTGPDTDPQREPEAIERLVAPQSRLYGQGAPPGVARRGDQALVPLTRRPHRQQPVTGKGDHLAPVLGDQ